VIHPLARISSERAPLPLGYAAAMRPSPSRHLDSSLPHSTANVIGLAPAVSIVLVFLLCSPAFAATGDATDDGPGEARPAEIEDSVRPGINDKFLSPELDVDHWVETFEGESREIFRERDRILKVLPLSRGARVADIGAGTGLFTWPMATRVGATGRVYAVEISPNFAQRLREGSRQRRLAQVSVEDGGERSIGLPAASVDLAFLCDTYHHFEYPKAMLASIREALRPGGELVVIDFERIEGKTKNWLLKHVRAGKQVFQSEILAAGFVLVEEVEVDGLEENYMLRFRRP
jgi:SAM-dependent methyltransferase